MADQRPSPGDFERPQWRNHLEQLPIKIDFQYAAARGLACDRPDGAHFSNRSNLVQGVNLWKVRINSGGEMDGGKLVSWLQIGANIAEPTLTELVRWLTPPDGRPAAIRGKRSSRHRKIVHVCV